MEEAGVVLCDEVLVTSVVSTPRAARATGAPHAGQKRLPSPSACEHCVQNGIDPPDPLRWPDPIDRRLAKGGIGWTDIAT
jgi:hypothetical protein